MFIAPSNGPRILRGAIGEDMNKNLIVRVWTDDEFRQSISADERALLPDSPAGNAELSDAYLREFAGGACACTRVCCATCVCTGCCGTCLATCLLTNLADGSSDSDSDGDGDGS
jgi:mersacidin/lichenicidin family type 2 lantibiotic